VKAIETRYRAFRFRAPADTLAGYDPLDGGVCRCGCGQPVTRGDWVQATTSVPSTTGSAPTSADR
jgi:hypothetical protein